MIKHLKAGLGLLLALPLAAAAATIPEPTWDNPKTNGTVYNGPIFNVNAAPPAYPVQQSTAQPVAAPAPVEEPLQQGLHLGGPRFGMSYISGGGFDKLKEAVDKAKPGTQVEPMMSQFGWQAEYRMFRTPSGITALTEWVPLIGGMDQGLALPSLTWLVGLRGKQGFEMGVGPNVGLNGVAMMLAAGYTFDLGGINLPLNFAVGRGANQTTSLALSLGFNL
jgi:hypothetical protein